MTHASLFSGIGGFDLAAEWAGWTNAFNCEIDPFCQAVLKYHFPNAAQYEDIRTTDFTIWRGRIDVLTGGFPCQPFSLAGKRKGTDDDRYLWPTMLGVIRVVRPRWVVGENVFGIVNWSDGMVFEQVCADLEAAGYKVQSYIIPAAGVGADHLRSRVWFVAHTNGIRLSAAPVHGRATSKEQVSAEHAMPSLEIVIADDFRSEPNKHGVVDGIPEGLDECSLKAYGNAIVPQVALQLFKTINEYELLHREHNTA